MSSVVEALSFGVTPKLPNDEASERRLVNASSQRQYMVTKLMQRPDIRKSFLEISWRNIWNLCATEGCVSGLRSFYSSVWESVRVYTTDGLWEIRGVKVRERERERERIWGKPRYRSLCLSLSCRTSLLRVCLNFLTGCNSQSAEGCSLEGAELCHPGKFRSRRVSVLHPEFVNGGGRLGDDYASSWVTRRGRCFKRKLHCHIQTSVLFPSVLWQEIVSRRFWLAKHLYTNFGERHRFFKAVF